MMVSGIACLSLALLRLLRSVLPCSLDTEEIICTYAHRMTNTRSHGPLDKLFGAAGVSLFAQADAVLRSLDAEEEGMACPLYP